MESSYWIAKEKTLQNKISSIMETLEMRVERLERMIGELAPKKEQWVGPTVVTGYTNWNKVELRNARRNGSIRYKHSGTGGYKYLLSSIPEHLIK